MPKRLTLKQIKFSQEYIKTGNAAQSARSAYDGSYSTAKVIGYQNLQKPHIQAYLEKILDDCGFSDERIASYLSYIVESGVNAEANASDALRAIEIVLKLKDRFPSHKIEAVSQNINIDYSATHDELLNQLHEVTEENRNLLAEISKHA